MARVFVSFDWDHDRRYKFLLEAWDANPNFSFEFDDATSGEINSDNVGRIKAALTQKIKDATHTLVIVGRYANSWHQHSNLIGFKNWINFEVSQSKAYRNRIAAVKLDMTNDSPDELLNAGVSWAYSFTQESVNRALNDA